MARVTRRQFVHTSLAAGAGLSLLPGMVRSEPGPNEKLGVAVVGVGGRGGSHIEAFLANPLSEIRYIVDADEQAGYRRCDQIEMKQGKRPTYVRDMRQAFDSKDVDVISTATPNHWHALCGIWAMQAGKDAYIEKPVCHNIAEGSALVAAARKYGRMCQVGTQCRSSIALHEAVKFLQSGGIGEVKFARGLCWKRRPSIGPKGDYPVPANVDFNLWSGPATFTEPKVTRERFHYDWHWQRHYGNGDLGNQGPHQTDIARWGLGLDRHPQSVICYGGRLGYQAERNDPAYIDAGDTGNTEVSIYDYGDKCIVFETRGLGVHKDEEVIRLWNNPPEDTDTNRIGVIFYGSEGYLVQRSYSHCVAYDKSMNKIRDFEGGGDHFGNFLNACVSRRYEDLHADVKEGHLSAAISHLGNISYYLGEANKVPAEEAKRILADIPSLDDNLATLQRTLQHLTDNGVDLSQYPLSMGPLLKFDSDRELFPDSPEATALVGREYREGFAVPTADQV